MFWPDPTGWMYISPISSVESGPKGTKAFNTKLFISKQITLQATVYQPVTRYIQTRSRLFVCSRPLFYIYIAPRAQGPSK